MSEQKESKKIYRIAALALVIILTAVIGGLCFYILTGPYDPGTLSITGSSANLSFGGQLNSYGKYTYYVEGGSMYCINPENNKTIVLDGENIANINADKNYIYYTSDGYIYSIRNKVTKKKLSDKKAVSMSVNGGWIYFTDRNGDMWKMDTSGHFLKQINSVKVTGSFAVDNGFIYFINGNDLFSIRANGLENTKKKLVSDVDGFFCYYGEAIFYKSTAGGIYSISAIDGSSRLFREKADIFNYSFNSLCFTDETGITLKNYTENTVYHSDKAVDDDVCGLFVAQSGDVFLSHGENHTLEKIDLSKVE